MSIIEPYGEHQLQTLKWFQRKPENKHTLVLIHGGAWRDPNNTYDDYQQLVDHLSQCPTLAETNIVGMNYRLSPEVKHPAHIEDVVAAINKIAADTGVDEVSIVGHSVGATLALQLLNYKEIFSLASGSATECTDLAPLRIREVFFLDGIYDMVDLIEEYGGPYRDFVEGAFSGDQYKNGSQVSWSSREEFKTKPEKIVVVQSLQDELLSPRQSRQFVDFLQSRGLQCTYIEENWGKHEEIYRRPEVAQVICTAMQR